MNEIFPDSDSKNNSGVLSQTLSVSAHAAACSAGNLHGVPSSFLEESFLVPEGETIHDFQITGFGDDQVAEVLARRGSLASNLIQNSGQERSPRLSLSASTQHALWILTVPTSNSLSSS